MRLTRPLAIPAFVVAAALLAGGAAHAQVRWETKLDRASAAAREANRPILIEFWAVACEPCAEMDQEVYSDDRMATAMQKVVPVRVDIDRDPGLARKYEVGGTPTLLVTDSFGRTLFRYDGALTLDRMLRLLDALPGDITRINGLSAVLAARKDDFEALAAMGRELRAAGFYRTSTEYFTRALKTREGRRPAPARDAILADIERNNADLGLPKRD